MKTPKKLPEGEQRQGSGSLKGKSHAGTEVAEGVVYQTCAQVPQEQSRASGVKLFGAGWGQEKALLFLKCRIHLDGNLTLLRCLCCCNLEIVN